MKNFLTTILLLAITNVFAQEVKKEKEFNNDIGKHEVRIGGINLLAYLNFNLNYERILDKYSGFGVTLDINTNSNLDDIGTYKTNLMISPYYRFYFSETKEYGAHGFFIEGFLAYINAEERGNSSLFNSNINYNYKIENFNSGAIGLGAGKKWVNKKGFVFEAYIGLGRSFSKTTITNETFFFPKGDLSIGYRF